MISFIAPPHSSHPRVTESAKLSGPTRVCEQQLHTYLGRGNCDARDGTLEFQFPFEAQCQFQLFECESKYQYQFLFPFECPSLSQFLFPFESQFCLGIRASRASKFETKGKSTGEHLSML